ncbi:MAG: hypothetical protein HY791_06220 [Deltaproteobacteria bacterium]|nr:hypothetical protein [Deltaproteobacteria bacterium]
MKLTRSILTSVAFMTATPALAYEPYATGQPTRTWGIRRQADPEFARVIQRVTQMPFDGELSSRVSRLGLNVVNVMWEDTGRYQGSAVGPNISDLTLQVRERVPEGVRTHLLPVIRHPNFSDESADVPADAIWVRVGNERDGAARRAVPLTEVLKNLKEYLSDPESLRGSDDFLARRDTHFLVSAQHVFVPLPAAGKAEFNPVLFNYQSAPGSPAVLTLLVTREGLSARVIENKPGDQSYQGWGQQLFFNDHGQKTTFTAERKSAVAARVANGQGTKEDEGALEEGSDMMMIVQIPLVHENRGYLGGAMDSLSEGAPAPGAVAQAPMAKSASRSERSDVEQAVIGHGDAMGTHEECGGLKLVRDKRFPIRVTVQFYKATSNGIVSDTDLAEVHSSIAKVYASADYVGSLVVPKSEHKRPTRWTLFGD